MTNNNKKIRDGLGVPEQQVLEGEMKRRLAEGNEIWKKKNIWGHLQQMPSIGLSNKTSVKI